MKRVNRVSNGVSRAEFSTRAIEDMKMLGLIQFRGTQTLNTAERGRHTVYYYTGAGDNRKVIK